MLQFNLKIKLALMKKKKKDYFKICMSNSVNK